MTTEEFVVCFPVRYAEILRDQARMRDLQARSDECHQTLVPVAQNFTRAQSTPKFDPVKTFEPINPLNIDPQQRPH